MNEQTSKETQKSECTGLPLLNPAAKFWKNQRKCTRTNQSLSTTTAKVAIGSVASAAAAATTTTTSTTTTIAAPHSGKCGKEASAASTPSTTTTRGEVARGWRRKRMIEWLKDKKGGVEGEEEEEEEWRGGVEQQACRLGGTHGG